MFQCNNCLPKYRSSLSVMSQGHQGICKVFASGNYCKFGKRCRYLHFRKPKSQAYTENDRHNATLRTYTDSYEYEESVLETVPPLGVHQYEDINNERYQYSGEPPNNSFEKHRKPCRFYASGYCAKGNYCGFLHVDSRRDVVPPSNNHRKDEKEEKKKTQPRVVRHGTICHNFKRGFCRYGDSCRWSHELPIIMAEDESCSDEIAVDASRNNDDEQKQGLNVEKANESSPAIATKRTLQLEFPIGEIGKGNNQVLRDKEMLYFKKRFPKAEKIGDGTFIFTFRPSDPDWPYDVRCLNMRVDFPDEYPTKPVTITLAENRKLPEVVQRYIWKTIEQWLDERFTEFEKKGKAELVMRACVRWLDRGMLEMFTEALKAYQRELMAKAAGIEFVTASQLREEFAKRQPDSDAFENDDRSNDDENGDETDDDDDSDDDGNDLLVANPNRSSVLEASKKGTEVKLQSFQLKEQAATLIAERIAIIVQCARCKHKTEFDTPPGRINVFGCAKCGQEQLVTFRASMAHQFTSIIGYLDMKDCGIHDMMLSQCHFKVGCEECGREMNFGGVIPGQLKESWCHSCHSKLVVAAESTKFLNLQPAELDMSNALQLNITKIKKVGKDPSIKEGFPLPNDGTCKHYKKSFRWFRFPCCGKVFPCDVCHDDSESHENVFANRMICGFCCKEQAYSADKACNACSSSLTKASSSHWEGGKGCRDKIKMSRNDDAKYKNTNKTVSRKTQAKGSSVKTTKLRHA